jgi:hypothetical protein
LKRYIVESSGDWQTIKRSRPSEKMAEERLKRQYKRDGMRKQRDRLK